MNLQRSCRLRALGMINALGSGLEVIGPRLFAADSSRLVRRDDLVRDSALLVGAVRDPLPAIPGSLARYRCRNNALALAALGQIAEPVSRAIEEWGAARVGVVVGSTTAGVDEAGAAVREQRVGGSLPADFDYVQLEQGGLSEFLALVTGARGPAYTISTACSSGARALASARRLLMAGVCDAVVAGGCDALCPLTAAGFTALEAVSDRTSRPFSGARDGLNLGEGAALFLLTRETGGTRLLGVGEAAEAHHMSAPDPGGSGAEAAMRAALEDAGVGPADVAYVNLHGTGTPLNDAMEARVVHRLLGEHAPCSSTKPLVGHMLGAAGATEAGFLWLALGAGNGAEVCLPPHVWDGQPDHELPPIALVGTAFDSGRRVVARDGWTVLVSSSFAFGGDNCVVVIGARR